MPCTKKTLQRNGSTTELALLHEADLLGKSPASFQVHDPKKTLVPWQTLQRQQSASDVAEKENASDTGTGVQVRSLPASAKEVDGNPDLRCFWLELQLEQRKKLLSIPKRELFQRIRETFCSGCFGSFYARYNELKSCSTPCCTTCRENYAGITVSDDGSVTLVQECIDGTQGPSEVFLEARLRERERELRFASGHSGEICGSGWQKRPGQLRCKLHTSTVPTDALLQYWRGLGGEHRMMLMTLPEEDFVSQLEVQLKYNLKACRGCSACRCNVMRAFRDLKQQRSTSGSEGAGPDDGTASFKDGSEAEQDHTDGAEVEHGQHSSQSAASEARPASPAAPTSTTLPLCNGLVLTVLDGMVCVETTSRAAVCDDLANTFFEVAEQVEEQKTFGLSCSGSSTTNLADLDTSVADMSMRHAETRDLAREALQESALLIFKAQVEASFREQTIGHNAQLLFVFLVLQLMEQKLCNAFKELGARQAEAELLELLERDALKAQQRRSKRQRKKKAGTQQQQATDPPALGHSTTGESACSRADVPAPSKPATKQRQPGASGQHKQGASDKQATAQQQEPPCLPSANEAHVDTAGACQIQRTTTPSLSSELPDDEATPPQSSCSKGSSYHSATSHSRTSSPVPELSLPPSHEGSWDSGEEGSPGISAPSFTAAVLSSASLTVLPAAAAASEVHEASSSSGTFAAAADVPANAVLSTLDAMHAHHHSDSSEGEWKVVQRHGGGVAARRGVGTAPLSSTTDEAHANQKGQATAAAAASGSKQGSSSSRTQAPWGVGAITQRQRQPSDGGADVSAASSTAGRPAGGAAAAPPRAAATGQISAIAAAAEQAAKAAAAKQQEQQLQQLNLMSAFPVLSKTVSKAAAPHFKQAAASTAAAASATSTFSLFHMCPLGSSGSKARRGAWALKQAAAAAQKNGSYPTYELWSGSSPFCNIMPMFIATF